MYRVEIGESGNYRDATPDEVQGINDHRDEYPKCKGKKIRDEGKQTLMRLHPRLRCTDCGVDVKVPV